MRIAHNHEGRPLEAHAEAPLLAICPYCGGEVSLRSRRVDGSARTYFWRHVRLNDLNCPGRSYPYRLKVNSASKQS